MIDPMVSLAFNIYSNKGVYALLLGSGVSRSASIPTGWEIIIDLITKIAHLSDESISTDPITWYKDKYGENPDYSKLLDGLSKTPTERNALLHSYFEPTEDDVKQGKKIPTKAHKEIANLVRDGFIKVIITTNFDRLIENAIKDVGIIPVVISTTDAIKGALPIIHTSCTIIKIHGDYKDVRIRNTINELETYDKEFDDLLDRIFDEFGFIICGWSAEWDPALCNALLRCKNHRFSTYWTSISDLTGRAKDIFDFRQCQFIKINDADSFFSSVAEKVSALNNINKSHPLSAKLAIQTIKKYIIDEKQIINLHDMINAETEKVYKLLQSNRYDTLHDPADDAELLKRINQYESDIEILQSMIIYSCYWGDIDHCKKWIKSINRLGVLPLPKSSYDIWLNLLAYPIIILFYCGGMAALAANKFDIFKSILLDTMISFMGRESKMILYLSSEIHLMTEDRTNILGVRGHPNKLSKLFFNNLREPFRELIPDDKEYMINFDKFEYLMSLVHAFLVNKQGQHYWSRGGCFIQRRFAQDSSNVVKTIEDEIKYQKTEWPLLKIGLFEGNIDELLKTKEAIDEEIRRAPMITF